MKPDKDEKTLNINLNVHVNVEGKVLAKLDDILARLEKPMAESPEVAAFRARVEVALANVSADIQRLLANATGLSPEDRATLEKIATDLEAVASVVPES